MTAIAAIDWQTVAERLGTIRWTGQTHHETGGTRVACAAMADILGDDCLVQAVNHAVSRQPGSEIARSILQMLRPPVAMHRCMAIVRSGECAEDVRIAAYLLGSICDARALDWYPEVLGHDDPIVRVWALKMLDSLWMAEEIGPKDVLALLQPALSDEAEPVRKSAARLVAMVEDNCGLLDELNEASA